MERYLSRSYWQLINIECPPQWRTQDFSMGGGGFKSDIKNLFAINALANK